MTCMEIARRDIQSVSPSCTVAQATSLMALCKQTLLPICSAAGAPLGVLSTRDVVLRVLAEKRSPALTRIHDVMSVPPRFVYGDAPLDLACDIMADDGVSRLLVLDAAGHLEGILSLSDVLRHASDGVALDAARRVLARRFAGANQWPFIGPALAEEPTPTETDGEDGQDGEEVELAPANVARVEADEVNRGGTNRLKEFP